MIEAGTVLTNPVTKEQMTFLKTAAETNGDYVLIELRAAPGGTVAAAHVHPSQTETFEVLRGKLGAKLGREQVELGAPMGKALGFSPVYLPEGDPATATA